MGAREAALGFPADPQILYGPLSRREKLELHLAVFFVGSGSLVMIDLTRSPYHLWFWPWVAGWAGALLVHCAVVLAQAAQARRAREALPEQR